jgi:hypothetical protein
MHLYVRRHDALVTNSKPWSRLAENGFSYVRTLEVQVLEWGQDLYLSTRAQKMKKGKILQNDVLPVVMGSGLYPGFVAVQWHQPNSSVGRGHGWHGGGCWWGG